MRLDSLTGKNNRLQAQLTDRNTELSQIKKLWLQSNKQNYYDFDGINKFMDDKWKGKVNDLKWQVDSLHDEYAKFSNDGKHPYKKYAILGYSYFPTIKRHESKNIWVQVSIKNPECKIRESLKNLERTQTLTIAIGDSNMINTIKNIPIYDFVTVTLHDPNKDFVIDSVQKSSRQKIDTARGNLWQWQVYTESDKRFSKLAIIVDAEVPAGIEDSVDMREIPITIEIDHSTSLRRAVDYLEDNPKVSIPILVALFGFIGWFIRWKLGRRTNG